MLVRVVILVSVGAAGFALGLAAVPSFVVGAPSAAADEAPVAAPRTRRLVVGAVAPRARDAAPGLTALGAELAARLDAFDHAELELAPDEATLAAAVADGRVDLCVGAPLSIARVHARVPLAPVARGDDDEAVLFVRDDSDIRVLADLPGRTLAFVDRHATFGFGLPFAHLCDRRLALRATDAPDGDEIGFRFSGDAETSLVWVLRGHVDAAALSDARLAALAGRDGSRLREIARSEPLATWLVCARRDVEPGLVASIGEALVSMADDLAGRSALASLGRTRRLTLLSDDELAEALRLGERVRGATGR